MSTFDFTTWHEQNPIPSRTRINADLWRANGRVPVPAALGREVSRLQGAFADAGIAITADVLVQAVAGQRADIEAVLAGTAIWGEEHPHAETIYQAQQLAWQDALTRAIVHHVAPDIPLSSLVSMDLDPFYQVVRRMTQCCTHSERDRRPYWIIWVDMAEQVAGLLATAWWSGVRLALVDPSKGVVCE